MESAGPIADRVGRKPTLPAVTVVSADAAIACATAPDVPTQEGTAEVHQLVLGQARTGTSAFQ